MSRFYRLEGHIPVPCGLNDVIRGNDTSRVVQQEQVGDLLVSTVFMFVDHNFAPIGPPLVFETMVFDEKGPLNYQARYSTWELALEGHRRAVDWAREHQCQE